jgi:putative resolvase
MKNTYSPREFGALIGRSVITLQRWDRQGIMKAGRTPTDRRYYTHEQYLQYIGQKAVQKKIVAYRRVSSSGQKKVFASQKEAVEQFCIASGRAVAEKLEDIGSGLNYKRKDFIRLMEMVERGEVSEIVIAHKDRLIRFGFEWFEKFCADHGCTITVMNAESLSPEEEMTKDLLSIIHCFSSRLYGLRKYRKKLHDMITEHENDQTA